MPPLPKYSVCDSEAMLCPRFVSILADFMNGEWLQCTPAMRPIEFYILFVHMTGWVVPINVAGWDQSCIPIQLRSRVAAAWLHETSYADLVAARQPLLRQLKTFLHALKRMIAIMDFSAVILKSAAFAEFGQKKKVQSI